MMMKLVELIILKFYLRDSKIRKEGCQINKLNGKMKQKMKTHMYNRKLVRQFREHPHQEEFYQLFKIILMILIIMMKNTEY